MPRHKIFVGIFLSFFLFALPYATPCYIHATMNLLQITAMIACISVCTRYSWSMRGASFVTWQRLHQPKHVFFAARMC